MPIVHVTSRTPTAGIDPQQVLSSLCTALATAFDCPPRQVWGTWQEPLAYVEGDVPAAEADAGTHPPIVRIVALEGRPQEVVERALRTAAVTLAEALALPADAPFVHYETMLRECVVWPADS
jgi:hypothetical protein